MNASLLIQIIALAVFGVIAYVGGRRDGRMRERRRWLAMLRVLNQTISPHHEFRSRVTRRAHQVADDGWTNIVDERDERGRRGA